jgi:hypothetical protein
MRRVWLAIAAAFAFGAAVEVPTFGGPAGAGEPTARAGKYVVTLRVPADGIYAEEEVEIEFRVVDSSNEDPILGAAGVIRAAINAGITMPSMAGMPAYEETAHVETVPGDYGIHPLFPHGGDYLLRLRVAPPADEPFTVEFPLKVKDADPNRPPAPKPFLLEVESKPGKVRAGEAAELRFFVRERENPREVFREFDVVHEKLLHLIVVRKDLGVFAHEHPEQQKDGTFKLRHTFPTAGTYHLFADLAPRGRGNKVLLATFDVREGKAAQKASPFALAAGAPLSKAVDSVTVSMAVEPGPPATRAQNVVTFTLADAATGAPVTDLEPYLGAMGHLVLVHEDGVTYVHSHPGEPAAGAPKNVVPFVARFAKPGLYRAWAQFQRKGKVLTADFVLDVRAPAR